MKYGSLSDSLELITQNILSNAFPPNLKHTIPRKPAAVSSADKRQHGCSQVQVFSHPILVLQADSFQSFDG
jgi:hypothetical protein